MAMVALDISKVFNAINHDLLLEKNSTIHSNVACWLESYLHGRTAVCIFQGATSPQLKCHSGVPQGSVLSPHLFNFFCHDFPNNSGLLENYANDFNLCESSPDIDTENLVNVSNWSAENELEITPSKFSVTLFTPHQANCCSEVLYEGSPIPLAKRVKWLGLTLTTLFV